MAKCVLVISARPPPLPQIQHGSSCNGHITKITSLEECGKQEGLQDLEFVLGRYCAMPCRTEHGVGEEVE